MFTGWTSVAAIVVREPELVARQLGSSHQQGRTVLLFRSGIREAISLRTAVAAACRWVDGLMRHAVVGCAMVLATLPAFAQTAPNTGQKAQVGSIHGTVTTAQADASAGLAGITVQLEAKPADGGHLTAETDDAGHYEFKDVTPGTYTISMNQPGFAPFTKALELKPGETAIVDIPLQLETVSEKVEVSEATQTIATEDATTPTVELTQRQLISLPTAQEKIREVLPVTPGVVKTIDGKLDFRGSDRDQSLLLVNSARTTDPVTGTFAVPVPTDAAQSSKSYKTPSQTAPRRIPRAILKCHDTP